MSEPITFRDYVEAALAGGDNQAAAEAIRHVMQLWGREEVAGVWSMAQVASLPLLIDYVRGDAPEDVPYDRMWQMAGNLGDIDVAPLLTPPESATQPLPVVLEDRVQEKTFHVDWDDFLKNGPSLLHQSVEVTSRIAGDESGVIRPAESLGVALAPQPDDIGLLLHGRVVGGESRLSEALERDLIVQLEEARLSQEILDNQPDLAVDVRAAHREVVERGRVAREQLIESQMRLVEDVARGYQNMGLPFPDLVQEGCFGLMQAVDDCAYKPDHRLSNYAFFKIRSAIIQAIAAYGHDHRLSVPMQSTLNMIVRRCEGMVREEDEVNEEVFLKAARELYDEGRFDWKKFHKGKVRDLWEYYQEPLSFSDESGGIDWQAFLSEADVLGGVESEEARHALSYVLQLLPKRQQLALALRIGAVDGIEHTNVEVGKFLGVTGERARQIIEYGAYVKLRQLLLSLKS